MANQYSRVSLKIVAIYALIGCLWILLSDKAIWLFTADHATISAISIVKGLLYVLLTALLLYFLIERYTAQIRLAENELKASKEFFLKAFTYSPVLMTMRKYTAERFLKKASDLTK